MSSTLRRNIRLKREYLYRKSLDVKERQKYERKERIKAALRDGKPIPTELRGEEADLRHEIDMEDDATAKPKSHIDDEYANAGVRDPKVCVTTARDPSSRLKMFAKEVKLMFPNSQRVNRGNTTMKELVEACRRNEFTDIVILNETRGEPDALTVSHLPYGPTAYFTLTNCVMRHDIDGVGPMSEAYPHLIFHNFTTPLGSRVRDILKHLYPVPKPEARRIVTFSNKEDYVSFRHHTYRREGKDVSLTEVGPRFDLKPYSIVLGTAEATDAEQEWQYRPYMNTTKKRTFL
jgi:U3 small nucleolar ribonucleoprotein protein IMP4